ncbi:MAG: hypothetical protein WCT53_00600 [Candidatus Gracilibacteria bacterium]
MGKLNALGGNQDELSGKLAGALTPGQLQSLPPALKAHLAQDAVVKIYAKPRRLTSCEQNFDFAGKEGIELRSGQEIVVLLDGNSDQLLETLAFGHKKIEKYWPIGMPTDKAPALGKYHDPDGAYTEVQVFDGITQQWRGWKDPMGYDPVKFAELRKLAPENEHMGCWYGMVGKVRPLAIRLISRGKGDPNRSIVSEYYLDVFTRPEVTPDVKQIERIYTPKTRFPDFAGPPKGPHSKSYYGGGEDAATADMCASPGGFPNAVPLGGPNGLEHFPLNKSGAPDSLDAQGKLHIKLPQGVCVQSVEIICGYRWTSKKVGNPPQFIAKVPYGHNISAILESGGKPVDKIIDKANTGPQGHALGGPSKIDYVTKPGDELVLSGNSTDTIYVMGVRVLYKAPTPQKTVSPQPAAVSKPVAMAVQKALNGTVTVKTVSGPPPGASSGKAPKQF